MRVMAAMSAATDGLTRGSLIANRPTKTKRPGNRSGAPSSLLCSLAAVAEQAQQHEEQIDEVEIKPQRPHYCLAAGDGAVVVDVIHFLDALRVIGGQANEDEHAKHRDDPIESARLQEDVHQACDDYADQTH